MKNREVLEEMFIHIREKKDHDYVTKKRFLEVIKPGESKPQVIAIIKKYKIGGKIKRENFFKMMEQILEFYTIQNSQSKIEHQSKS